MSIFITEDGSWAGLVSHVLRSVGLELIIFSVTLCVALVIRASAAQKPQNKATVTPPSPEAVQKRPAIAPRRSPVPLRQTSVDAGAMVNDIIDGMGEQQNIRFAHRALHLYEDLRALLNKENMKIKDAIQYSKYDAAELYTMLVHCSVRAGRHHVIDAMIEDMIKHDVPRSMSFYECTMKQLAGQKQYTLALKMYERMDSDGLTPSVVTLSCLIGFAAEVGELQRAVGFFDRLSQMTIPSIRAYMTVLRVHAKRQDWTTSVETLKSMARIGVKPDSLALNVVLATGVAADQMDAVSEFLDEIQDSDFAHAVDIISYNTLIKGYAQHGDVEGAIKSIDKLCKRGLAPNAITFNTAMDGAVRGRRYNEAWLLMDKMSSFGIHPDKFTCSILVKGFCQCMKDRDVASCWTDRFKGILALLDKVDYQLDAALRSSLYHSVLECAVQAPIQGPDLVEKVFAQMRRHQISVNATAQRLLLQALPKGSSLVQ